MFKTCATLFFAIAAFPLPCDCTSVDAEAVELDPRLTARFTGPQWFQSGSSARFLAYFNEVSFSQLERPTIEIYDFCKSSGGKASRSNRYVGDPLGKFYVKSNQMALYAAATAAGVGRLDLAQSAAEYAWQQASELSLAFDEKGARSAYETVAKKGAYADWICSYGAASQRDWAVSIRPIGFVSHKPSDILPNHKLVIEVRALPAR